MVEVGSELVIVVSLLLLSIGLQLEARYSGMKYLNGYDDALDQMKDSLNIVAEVLKQLPNLVPQFSINENPLSQILQFFQQRAEQQNPSEASLDAERLREPDGTYSHGKNDEG
jgi:hypothetical protein